MDNDSLAALRADLGDEDGVWPEHVAIVAAFFCCQTQWRVASMTSGFATVIRYVGLDYAACRVALEIEGFEVTPMLWNGFKIMELAAAGALNEAVAA